MISLTTFYRCDGWSWSNRMDAIMRHVFSVNPASISMVYHKWPLGDERTTPFDSIDYNKFGLFTLVKLWSSVLESKSTKENLQQIFILARVNTHLLYIDNH